MKARIRKTGEIVDVYHVEQHGCVSNIYRESVLVDSRTWTEDELEFYEEREKDNCIDAFIERACEWLKEIFSEYENLTDYNPMNDFKNYMKGE